MGNGRAAMDLMGQWAPSTFAANAKDEKGPDVGWFPFPTVPGGAGTADAQLGGGDGFSCRQGAAGGVDFPKYVVSPEVQQVRCAQRLPVAKGSESSVKDPTLKGVLDARGESSYVQTLPRHRLRRRRWARR